MKSKDDIIHELEQQVSDMAMEIVKLRKIKDLYAEMTQINCNYIDEIMLLDIRFQEVSRSHQSNSIPLDL